MLLGTFPSSSLVGLLIGGGLPLPESYIRVVSFNVTADAYTRFMGRFSEPLAVEFVKRAGVREGQRALDVGCGPGALTTQLVHRLGATAVSAIDPSAPFVAATRARLPAVDVRCGAVEHLPFPDDIFDLTLAQLVVHFMADPVQGVREMSRVTRPGGLVGACVWDLAGDGGPLAAFWRAARDLDSGVRDEAELAGARAGHLAELFAEAGLQHIQPSTLTVTVRFETFADWWEPFTLGVGPAGDYVAHVDDARRGALRARCAEVLPPAPFELAATAWYIQARA
jgi:SAM-dependent methyltransferase